MKECNQEHINFFVHSVVQNYYLRESELLFRIVFVLLFYMMLPLEEKTDEYSGFSWQEHVVGTLEIERQVVTFKQRKY